MRYCNCIAVQCSEVKCSAVQCSEAQCSEVPCSAKKYSAVLARTYAIFAHYITTHRDSHRGQDNQDISIQNNQMQPGRFTQQLLCEYSACKNKIYIYITTALQDNSELYNRALPSRMRAGLNRKRLSIGPQGRSQLPAASEAAHCRIRFGRRPAYVRSWPKAKLACAVPKSRELGQMVEQLAMWIRWFCGTDLITL